MQISSATSLNGLYIEQFAFRVRQAPSPGPIENGIVQDPTSERIRSLVDSLHQTILEKARRGGDATGLQNVADAALSEVSRLLGAPLLLGGSANAVVQGQHQPGIEAMEVLSLPANANAVFDDVSIHGNRPAEIYLADIDLLMSDGGYLEVSSPFMSSRAYIGAGSSRADLVRTINSSRLGLEASETQHGIVVRDRHDRSAFQLSVQSQYESKASAVFTINGQNGSQITSVQHDGLAVGQTYTLEGTRDSLAAAAAVEYVGENGLVAGSASFDLTGKFGTERIEIEQGETLAALANRVNLASGATGVEASVASDRVVLRSSAVGSQSHLQVSNVQHAYQTSVEGVNAAQISGFQLHHIPDGASLQLQGSIDQAAERAELIYHGTPTATVVDSASFTLEGSLGSAVVQIVKDESLQTVQQRINDLSGSTGIEAEVQGNDLALRSINANSNETIQVSIDEVAETVEISGVNSSQVSDFQLLTHTPNASNTLSAEITQAATQGSLEYTGFLGTATSSAQISVSGLSGSASISISAFQSLTSIRDAINAKSADTGVTATTAGSTLTFESTGFGSEGIVQIAVQSGNFNTSGGDGNGNAIGQDAVLNINGNSVTAAGSSVAYDDTFGSYSFTLQSPNTTQVLDPISIVATDGTFAISGGDGSGFDAGQDAVATLNGAVLTGVGNHFATTIDGLSFEFDAVDGFLGSLDPIELTSTQDEFSIVGVDAEGNSTGTDATASINGQMLASTSNTFVVPVGPGFVTLDFAEGFLGEFDTVTIVGETSDELVQRTFNRSYDAQGSQGGVAFQGNAIASQNGVYMLEQNGVSIALKLKHGFSGKLQPLSVRAGGVVGVESTLPPLSGQKRTAVQEALADLFLLASGNSKSGFQENFADALIISATAQSRLQVALGETDPFGAPRRSLLDVFL